MEVRDVRFRLLLYEYSYSYSYSYVEGMMRVIVDVCGVHAWRSLESRIDESQISRRG